MVLRTRRSAERLIIGRHKFIKQFNVNEYIDNPPLIEKLHEEKTLALCDFAEVQGQLDTTRTELQVLGLDNQALRQELDQMTRQATHMFVLSLLAVVLLGLGVNVATTKPNEWLGWALIVAGILGGCRLTLHIFVDVGYERLA